MQPSVAIMLSRITKELQDLKKPAALPLSIREDPEGIRAPAQSGNAILSLSPYLRAVKVFAAGSV